MHYKLERVLVLALMNQTNKIAVQVVIDKKYSSSIAI